MIARPFIGATAKDFVRTSHRKDFSIPPLAGNLLERADAAGREIVSIGKIGDIFAHCDTGKEWKGKSNADNVDLAVKALNETADGGFIFVNLVDFDTEYGHRRDVPGFAACLEAFDARLPEIRGAMRPGDFAVLTADHGNDPTWRGYDHTREHAPIVAFGAEVRPGPIGARASFSDIGETVARTRPSRGADGQELAQMSFVLDPRLDGRHVFARRLRAVARVADERRALRVADSGSAPAGPCRDRRSRRGGARGADRGNRAGGEVLPHAPERRRRSISARSATS